MLGGAGVAGHACRSHLAQVAAVIIMLAAGAAGVLRYRFPRSR